MIKCKQLQFRGPAVAFAALAIVLITGTRTASADGTGSADCGTCRAAAQSLSVDPTAYRLWPSGARTLLNVVWSPSGSNASFKVVNSGALPAAAANVTVVVDNHDPLSQTTVGSATYSYAVPALAPQSSASISVLLDYTQCDIFLSVDLGSGAPAIFRTGNPATC